MSEEGDTGKKSGVGGLGEGPQSGGGSTLASGKTLGTTSGAAEDWEPLKNENMSEF